MFQFGVQVLFSICIRRGVVPMGRDNIKEPRVLSPVVFKSEDFGLGYVGSNVQNIGNVVRNWSRKGLHMCCRKT